MFFYCVRILLFFCSSAFVFKVGGVNYQKRPSCRAIWTETNISPKSSDSFVYTLNLLPKRSLKLFALFFVLPVRITINNCQGSLLVLPLLSEMVCYLVEFFLFFLPYLSIKNKSRPFWLFWQTNNSQFKKRIYYKGSVLRISKSALANHEGESNYITKCS